MDARLTLAALFLAMSALACTDTVESSRGGGGGGGDGDVTLNSSDRQVINAICAIFDRCRNEIGQVFEANTTCSYFYTEFLLEYIQGNADPADASACSSFLNARDCAAFAADDDAVENDACERATNAWFDVGEGDGSYRSSSLGEFCRWDDDCFLGGVCQDDDTGGPACERCVSIIGAACTDDYDCEDSWPYFCEQGSCQIRDIGDPCTNPSSDRCGSDDFSLTCINGDCAVESELNGPCDDDDDCATSGGCSGGSCVAASPGPALIGRGDTCVTDFQCAGFLACRGGICTDAPGEGEPCEEKCLLPNFCDGGFCVDFNDFTFELPDVGIGQVCRESCGTNCTAITANCLTGYCDRTSLECEPFRTTGDPCDWDNECNEAVAFCSWITDSCETYTVLGQPCSLDQQCNDELNYCDDDSSTCQPSLPDGSTCTDRDQCLNSRCVGFCAGGLWEGYPCDEQWQCWDNQEYNCEGLCADWDEPWVSCAP